MDGSSFLRVSNPTSEFLSLLENIICNLFSMSPARLEICDGTYNVCLTSLSV